MAIEKSIKVQKMSELWGTLSPSECKFMILLVGYLEQTKRIFFSNNKEFRQYLWLRGFDKTPQRISDLLRKVVKKRALGNVGYGVYAMDESIYFDPYVDPYNII